MNLLFLTLELDNMLTVTKLEGLLKSETLLAPSVRRFYENMLRVMRNRR